jgi:predicted NBD/HSP70 family sugar kinase
MNPYKKQIEAVLAGLKKDINLTEAGRQAISFALALATQWGAGDALAAKILDDWGLPAIGKISAIADALKIEVSKGGFGSPSTWWVQNLDKLADGFLTKDVADKLKVGAGSGRGI